MTTANGVRLSWIDDRARLLSWIAPALMGISLLALLAMYWPGRLPNLARPQYTVLIVCAVAGLAAGYGLNRAGNYHAGSRLTVLAALLGTWGALVIDRQGLATNAVPLFYLVYVPLLGSLLLESRAMLGLFALQLAGIGLLIALVPLPADVNFVSLVFFNGFAATLALLGNLIARRNRSELAQQTTALAESEQRFRQVFEAGGIAMTLVDLDYRIIAVNEALGRLVGYSTGELLGRSVTELSHPDDVAADRQLAQRLARGEMDHYQLKKRYRHRSGQVVWVNLTRSLIRNAQGQPAYYVSLLEDISAREQAEAALKGANAQLAQGLRALAQRTRELAQLHELGSRLQNCRSVEEAWQVFGEVGAGLFEGLAGVLYAWEPETHALRPVTSWRQGPTLVRLSAADCGMMADGLMRWSGNGPIGCACALKPERAKDFHLCLPIVDREATLGVLHLRPVAAGWPGEAEAYERLAETVAESLGLAWGNLRLHETLREQSVRDPLTGLFNRRYLEATAERELGRAERQGHALGLVLIDLDYLKHYNDTYGHRAGDTLLRSVARLLASNTRASDVASRLGGDEFCLILAEATLPSTLERAEQLRAALNRMSVQHDGRDLGQVTVSMGVAAYPEHGLDWPRLFEAADQALYRAKAEGRNELRVAREPNPPAPFPLREGGAF